MGPTWNGTDMKWPPLAWIRTAGHEMGPTWNGTGMKWDIRTWNGTDMKWDGHEMARHDLANMIWADMKWPGMKWDIPQMQTYRYVQNSRMHTSISWLEYKRPVGTPRSKSCWFIPRYWFIRCMYKVLEVFKLQPRITKYTNEKITEKLDDKTFLDLTSGYKNANLVLKLSQSQHRNINFQISQRGYVEWWIE